MYLRGWFCSAECSQGAYVREVDVVEEQER